MVYTKLWRPCLLFCSLRKWDVWSSMCGLEVFLTNTDVTLKSKGNEDDSFWQVLTNLARSLVDMIHIFACISVTWRFIHYHQLCTQLYVFVYVVFFDVPVVSLWDLFVNFILQTGMFGLTLSVWQSSLCIYVKIQLSF